MILCNVVVRVVQVKVLQKELEQMRVLQQKSSEEQEQTLEQRREVDKQLKHAQWQIQVSAGTSFSRFGVIVACRQISVFYFCQTRM